MSWTGNQFVVVGVGVTIMISADGTQWAQHQWSDDFRIGGDLFSVAGSASTLVAVGDDAGIARSH